MATAFNQAIVIELKLFDAFYPAEIYHQDYYVSNPAKPYCEAVISPKLKKFRELFKDRFKG